MRIRPTLKPLGLAVLLLSAATAVAQIDGTRGIAPVDSAGSYEVGGIIVDVAAKTADAARLGGWRLAQRKAWGQLSRRMGGSGGALSDGELDAIVSGIVVEHEEIGPNRYIAKLGVLFDRARAGSILGISAYADRSPPMLVIPVIWSGGVGQVFEQQTDWQQAWARFRTGSSTIDYVRPSGTGPDSLLLTVGQTERPDRAWWRKVIDQYGATDILIPTVRLYRQWPGGPVIGVFQARYGPDNRLLGQFTLRVGNASGIAQLLDTGVKRLDDLYAGGLRTGALRPDASLLPLPSPTATPTDDSLATDDPTLAQIVGDVVPTGQGIPVTIQFDTPGAAAVAATEGVLRGIPGVRSAATTSLALGGVSVLRVVYDGDPGSLKAALEVRGYQVLGDGQSLRIRRAPQLLPPGLPADGAPAG